MAPWVLALLAILWLAGCSGQAASPLLSGQEADAWPAHNWDGAVRQAAYAVAAVDATERNILNETASLGLAVTREAETETVTITGADLARSDRAFLHLKYDAQSVSPLAVAPDLAVAGDALFLGLTDVPGLVTVG
ncbi:MAG TPA: hypothetical protein ENO21_02125, partial [Firmicutes bacterium]|nr:hypothetical protein [Bacillota bacterium]